MSFKGFNIDYSKLDAQMANAVKQIVLQSKQLADELNSLTLKHNEMNNLEYSKSGHTGFAPEDTDTWHYIGDSGEPVFDKGSEYDVGQYGNARFKKIGNTVKIKGVVNMSDSGILFTLPDGYRPINQVILRVLYFNMFTTDNMWYWKINTDGTIENTGGALSAQILDIEFDIDE